VSSWEEIQERRKLKKKVNDAKSEILRKRWLKEYRQKDKMVKRCLTRDKRQWTDDIAKENATNLGSMKGVYDATRKLCNDRPRNFTMVKDEEGKLLTKDNDVSTGQADITRETPTTEEIEINYITKEEIRKAVRDMNSGKTAGMDSITVEMLKVDVVTTTYV